MVEAGIGVGPLPNRTQQKKVGLTANQKIAKNMRGVQPTGRSLEGKRAESTPFVGTSFKEFQLRSKEIKANQDQVCIALIELHLFFFKRKRKKKSQRKKESLKRFCFALLSYVIVARNSSATRCNLRIKPVESTKKSQKRSILACE